MADDYSDDYMGGSANRRGFEDSQATRPIEQPVLEEPARPKTPREKEEERLRRQAELEEEARRKREEEERLRELELRRNKRKLITPGVMLGFGAISSIVMFFSGFDNRSMLIWLLVILLMAWVFGGLIQYMFEKFAYDNEHIVSEEGEVINKGTVVSDDAKAEENG